MLPVVSQIEGGVMRQLMINFCRDENGATVLEYAWIASLISIAALAAFDLIESKMESWYWAAAGNMN
jgi:Flp pilus assembly pilin Flp